MGNRIAISAVVVGRGVLGGGGARFIVDVVVGLGSPLTSANVTLENFVDTGVVHRVILKSRAVHYQSFKLTELSISQVFRGFKIQSH